MSELIKDIELMTFNFPMTETAGGQYNIQIESLEAEIERIMNSGSIGYVTFCQEDDMKNAFIGRESAGFIQSYELVRNTGTNVIWLYADIVLTAEAIGFRNLFPDLSGFAMRSIATIFETDYGRLSQIKSIQGFDYTFVKDSSKR